MATKGTRKRPKQTDPNPLFCQWLREWRDEAEAKGWKTKFTYAMVKYLHLYIFFQLGATSLKFIITYRPTCIWDVFSINDASMRSSIYICCLDAK